MMQYQEDVRYDCDLYNVFYELVGQGRGREIIDMKVYLADESGNDGRSVKISNTNINNKMHETVLKKLGLLNRAEMDAANDC